MTPDELSKFRADLGISQREFGLLLGKLYGCDWYKRSNITVYSWENGRKPIPDWVKNVRSVWDAYNAD